MFAFKNLFTHLMSLKKGLFFFKLLVFLPPSPERRPSLNPSGVCLILKTTAAGLCARQVAGAMRPCQQSTSAQTASVCITVKKQFVGKLKLLRNKFVVFLLYNLIN
jgi:hypothetical protein